MHVWNDGQQVTYTEKPSVGRIVRYLMASAGGGLIEMPAVIVSVHTESDVSLGLFERTYRFIGKVPYTQDVDTAGAWKWPARGVR